jgi:fumarylacetoacetate (FAA) hydrolase family protein
MDTEGENPPYLSQTRIDDGNTLLGAFGLISSHPLHISTTISLDIQRGLASVFSGGTGFASIRRDRSELAGFLFPDYRSSTGAYLTTGTGHYLRC